MDGDFKKAASWCPAFNRPFISVSGLSPPKITYSEGRIAGIPGKGLLLILGRVITSIIVTIDLGYLCVGLLGAMTAMAKSKTASCYDWKKKCYTVMFEYGFSSILSTTITELKENCRFAKQGTCAQCGEDPDGAHGSLSEEKIIKVRFQMILDYMGSEFNKKNGTLTF